ncbi:DUF5989 family protein [Alphaproteobacteria bacterium]|nr:DUF5989 family protein [Alphaproteobacteria bacterium]
MLHQLVKFLIHSKKFWLAPSIILVVLIGGLLVLTKTTVIAPFIYSIF